MRPLLLALVSGLLAASAAHAQAYSRLWGRQGELWTDEGRLPDFSMAGYHRGDDPIPTPPVTHNVRDFGAVGDGRTDDSDAFLRAVASVPRGVILVPAGRYVLTRIVEITRPDLVIRGEDRDRTVLYFPKTLTDVKPDWGATTTGDRTSEYSWSGGFLWVRGSYRTERLVDVAAPARRGERVLRLASAAGLAVGREVELRQEDTPANTLARELYSDDAGEVDNLNGRTRATQVVRITAIDGSRVTLDRPLRFAVRGEWRPALYRWEPTVREVGIENLTFEFPVTDYRGHFTELGYNPIALQDVAHCWVRNVRLRNVDSGPFVGSRFCTLEGIVYESERKPDAQRKSQGHHGVYISQDDNLFTRFDFRQQFQHDVSVSHAGGNVVSSGRGVDLCLDHHRRAPYANLFTDIDAGEGTHLWRSGGGAKLGKHAGAWETFWNVRTRRPQSHPGESWGPWSMNLVGLTTGAPSVTDPRGRWFEAVPPEQLHPRNLHEAQLARRRGGAAAGTPELLRGVRRVLVLGNSITHAGDYLAEVEAALLARGIVVEVLNLGLPSETATPLTAAENAEHLRRHGFGRPALDERLERVLAATRPELVVAAYGMNDGSSLPAGEEGVRRFGAAIERLREAARRHGVREVVHLTPPVYDAAASPAAPDFDPALARLSDWLVARRADGWRVVDVHGPMRRALDERRRADPSFAFARDGVHPQAEGHALIARELLAGLGVSAPAAPLAPRARELVKERMALLRDAWLTHTGHTRPGLRAGLPLDEARARAAELGRRICPAGSACAPPE